MSGFKVPEEEKLSSQELLKRTLDLERVKKERHAAGSSVSLFVDKIRLNYQTLILSDPTYARAKDAIARLWKQCFYGDIEDLRKGMQTAAAALRRAQEQISGHVSMQQQLQQQLEPHRGSSAASPPPQLLVRSPSHMQAAVQQEQGNLVRLTADFKTLSVKTTTFFTNLLVKIERLIEEAQQRLSVARTAVDATLPGTPAHSAASGEVAREVQLLIDLEYLAHRCLIYLGDTARYQEMHSAPSGSSSGPGTPSISIGEARGQGGKPVSKHNTEKSGAPAHNWHVAQRFYYRALKLVPGSGHAHNQLAVTAVYAEADVAALYHHCCSVLVEERFATGAANLELFFKKNAKVVINGDNASLTPVKALSRRYIRLHGILFELGSCGDADRSQAPIEEFHSTLEDTVGALPNLLAENSLSEGTLLKMVSIALYSVFTAHQSEAETGDICRSLSLIVLFSTVNRIAMAASKVAKTPKAVSPLLSGLVAFAMWGTKHPDLMRNRSSVPESSSQHSAGASQRVFSGLFNLENRSRSSMRSSLSTLCEMLFDSSSLLKLPNVPGKGRKLAELSISDVRLELEAATLREFSELVAYAPVAECIVAEMEEHSCCSLNDVEPSVAFVYRCFLLQDFVAHVLVPTAVVTQPLLTPKNVIDANIEREIASRKAQYKAAAIAKKQQAKELMRQARNATKERKLKQKSQRLESKAGQRRGVIAREVSGKAVSPAAVRKVRAPDDMSIDGEEDDREEDASEDADNASSSSLSENEGGDSSDTGSDEASEQWGDEDNEGVDLGGDSVRDPTEEARDSKDVSNLESNMHISEASRVINQIPNRPAIATDGVDMDDDLDEVIVYKPSFVKPQSTAARIDPAIKAKTENAFGGAGSSFFGTAGDDSEAAEMSNGGSMHNDIAYSLFGGGFKAVDSLSFASAPSASTSIMTETPSSSDGVARQKLDDDVAFRFSWRERMHAASANQHARSSQGASRASRQAPPGFEA